MREAPGYSSLMKDSWKHQRNACKMTLTDLKKDDSSVYGFEYLLSNATGHYRTCHGACGVLLQVLDSPVSSLVRTLDVPVADWRVMEGQRITLTCVSTCAASLTPNPGYIWYKDQLQLDGSRTYSSVLDLDPVSNEDAGSYACAVAGFRYLPSSAVNLIVRKNPSRGHTSETGSETSFESPYNRNKPHSSISTFTLSNVFILSFCFGLVVVTSVVLLLLKFARRNTRIRQCDETVPGPPNPNPGSYLNLDLNAISADYETLDNVRHSPLRDTIYENLYVPAAQISGNE